MRVLHILFLYMEMSKRVGAVALAKIIARAQPFLYTVKK